jgi:hypothetical protein
LSRKSLKNIKKTISFFKKFDIINNKDIKKHHLSQKLPFAKSVRVETPCKKRTEEAL